jgi:hypothetical protein
MSIPYAGDPPTQTLLAKAPKSKVFELLFPSSRGFGFKSMHSFEAQ